MLLNDSNTPTRLRLTNSLKIETVFYTDQQLIAMATGRYKPAPSS